MNSAEQSGIGEILTILELLAAEAPPTEIEDLLRRTRSAGLDAAALPHLERAERLAFKVHALFARRQQREAELSALVDTARDLTLPYDLDELLRTITRRTRTLLGLDMSYISFRDVETGDSYVRTADGHASALTVGYRVPYSSGIGDESINSSVPIWTPDYLSDERLRHSSVLDEVVRAEGLRAIIAAPLKFGDDAFGVLYAADRNVRHFTVTDVSLMSSLGDMAAVAIEKTRTLERSNADVADLKSGTSRAKSQLSEFRRLGELHARLVDLALSGSNLNALVAQVAEALQGAVLVRDMEHRTLTGLGTIPAAKDAEMLRACHAAYARRTPVTLSSGTWVAPVMAGNEELAVLLLHPDDPLDDTGVPLLRLAAQSIAVLLQVQRGEEAAASPFRDELFEDLLVAPHRPAKQFIQRARRLSIDLQRPHVVVVIRPEGGTQGRAASWAASYARRLDGLRSIQSGCIALLLPTSDSSAAARAVSEELTPLLGHPVTVGAAGPVTGPDLVQQTHQEALRCLDALVALDSVGAYASPKDLGYLGVLLSDNRDATSFISATIGPILDYDTQRMTELTRTLDAYFAAGGSPTYAAEALHVHPNTVSRRLERITELLGADWLKPEQALEVQLALRLHRTHDVLRQKRDDGAPAQADKPEH
ncbi:helix-turn-helix domain-containing protein [Streptomyces inhibens]|uniref:helix-turn-helix domain-containing protein n=1 Tax=Streptomyces inhibens TaxID=2293571 RepID=UPI001EE72AB1|nr:helix-turn-helix domain-containing protein [Streptomyces inhibens]UKY53516.1 helix-turn-helix domain-containing protein [Streptomyces inhibens]